MPVAVGVILAIILLVSFSGWFTQMFQGWREFIIDDTYLGYRIAFATLFSVTIITLTFLGMAYAYECPGERIEGEKTILSGVQCESYIKIKTGAEEMFKKASSVEDQTIPTGGMESFIED